MALLDKRWGEWEVTGELLQNSKALSGNKRNLAGEFSDL